MENSVLHFVVQTKKAMESNYKSFKQGSNMILFWKYDFDRLENSIERYKIGN